MSFEGFERSLDITRACIAHVMYRHGLQEEPPPSLAEYSLRDLLDANHAVRAHNSEPRGPDGKRTIHTVCDDRLVAALYVATHYRPSPAEEPEPIVLLPDRVLLCVTTDAVSESS